MKETSPALSDGLYARNSVLFLITPAIAPTAAPATAGRASTARTPRVCRTFAARLPHPATLFLWENKELFYYVFIKSQMMYVYTSLFHDRSSIVYGLAYEVTN